MSSVHASGYPAPGARIGRFRIMEQLGQGGMGVVFRALEENLGREVALKVIAPHFAHDPDFRERFTREARAQASLESAHVVAVYAHGEEGGYLYIASQLILDGDLGQLIRSAGVPPLVDALDVIEQVASGLSDAHEAGLIHRDIKPGNVLVRLRGNSVRAYLADFGIARRIDADATRLGSSAVGTPSYMAPELHGGAPASVATDVYSLGCLLWVALTGTPPYTGSSEYQIVGAHISQPVPQLTGTSPMVQATNRILRFAMAKEPAQRYRSAAAMRADLQAALRLPAHPGAAPAEQAGATALRPATPGGVPAGFARTPTGGRTPNGGGTPTPSRVPTTPPPTWSPGTGTTGGYAGTRGGSRRPLVIGLAVAAVVALVGGIVAALALEEDGSPNDPDGGTSAAFTELPASEILIAGEKEMKVLDSVRVQGRVSDPDGDLEADLVVTSAGNCSGTMSYVSGGTTELLRVDDRVLVKPDLQFLETLLDGDAALFHDALDGDWFDFKDTDAWVDLCDLDRLLERDGREDATVTTLGTETIEGQEVVNVELTEAAEREVVSISTAEPHYIVKIDEGDDNEFIYSDYNVEPDITVPSEDEIVTEKELLERARNGG